MKQFLLRLPRQVWFWPIVKVGVSAWVGSILLQGVTYGLLLWLAPRFHDVQFTFLITAISLLGGILGAVSCLAFLLARARRFRLAAGLVLVFGLVASVLPLMIILQAPHTFDHNPQPFVEAWSYAGLTLLWSVGLILWGLYLLFQFRRQ